jgi:hypothetical protein
MPGSQFDLVTVTDSATLGGRLLVSLTPSFYSVMTNGARFTVLTAGNPLSGAFANVASGGSVTTMDGYAQFTVLYANATTLQLADLLIVDVDSDGMPDWWEDRYGLEKGNAADAVLDFDGDGARNADEFRAGTVPNDPISVFRIVGLEPEAGQLRLTWTTVGGKSYRVQTNGAPANGSFTNNYSDSSPLISIMTTGESITNYLVPTVGITNVPARYYRVRLVP